MEQESMMAKRRPMPGDQLRKPSVGTPRLLKKPADTRYVVKRGDTLSGIAKRNGTSLSKVLALNPRLRKNPDLIFRGTRVRLK
jgi:LysM repeat protein